MKKGKISAILALFSLVIISASNISVSAAPPSWVGVSVGEVYTWDFTIDQSTFADYATDAGGTDPLTDFGAMFSTGIEIQFRLTVKYISDLKDLNGSMGVEINCSAAVGMSGFFMDYGSMLGGNSPDMVFFMLEDNTTSVLGTTMTVMMNETMSIIPFVFIPTNTNFTKVAEEANSYFAVAPEPLNENMSCTEITRGIRLTVAAGGLNPSQKKIDIDFTYSEKGVLNTADFKYDSSSMMSMAPSTAEENIPGFELTIIIGISAIGAIGLIYVVKKKKRLIS